MNAFIDKLCGADWSEAKKYGELAKMWVERLGNLRVNYPDLALSIYSNLGQIYYYLGLKEEGENGIQTLTKAADAYTTAIEMRPNSFASHYNRALVYERLASLRSKNSNFRSKECAESFLQLAKIDTAKSDELKKTVSSINYFNNRGLK